MNNGGYVEDQTLKDKFFNTEGRLNRLRYFKRCLLLFVITFLCSLVVFVAFSDDYGNITSRAEMGLLVIGLVGSFAGYCLNLRRMQDIGSVNAKKIALAILAIDILFCFDISENLTAVLGLISLPVALYMLFCPGTVGPNEYGPDPLGSQVTIDVGNADDSPVNIPDIPVNNFNASFSNNSLLNNIQPTNTTTANNEVNNLKEDENISEENGDDDQDDNDDGFNATDLF